MLPGWVAGSELSEAGFREVFFDTPIGRGFAGQAQAVGRALAAPSTDETAVMRTAGEQFAELVMAARPEAVGRVMTDAAAQAATPAAQALVRQATARQPTRATPGTHPTTRAARPSARTAAPPLTPAQRQRQENIHILGNIIYNEARESPEAMTAVAHAVHNRMVRNKTQSVANVARGFAHGNPNPRELESAKYEEAKQLAAKVLDGLSTDPTNGATHFYSPQRMAKEDDRHGDISGGLEDVPGVVDKNKGGIHVKNYRPGWATEYLGIDVPNVPERLFKFFRAQGTGHVR